MLNPNSYEEQLGFWISFFSRLLVYRFLSKNSEIIIKYSLWNTTFLEIAQPETGDFCEKFGYPYRHDFPYPTYAEKLKSAGGGYASSMSYQSKAFSYVEWQSKAMSA